MRRIQNWAWSDPLYDVTVVLVRGDSNAAQEWLDKKFGDVNPETVGQWTGAKTLWVERPRGVALVLWFPQWFTVKDGTYLSVLAHESFHAAEFVLRERGLRLTDESDEAYAYYIAWIFRECYKRLK